MNDELPDLFRDVVPRPAPAESRPAVLAAVGRELTRRRKPRWERIAEWSVAASLVLGVGLNVWQVRREAAWQSRVLGPLPDATAAVEGPGFARSATDPAAGNLADRLLWSAWPAKHDAGFARYRQYQQLLNEFTNGKGHGVL